MSKQSWPVSLQMGMESAAFSLTGVLVGWLGTTALAAHQVMITVSQVFFMIYYGIAAAVSVRVSFYVGQNDITELRRVTAAGFHIICMIGCVVSIPVFLLRHETGFIFANDATIAEICAHVTLIMIVYQFGDGMQCCYANALRGTGHVQPMVYIAFVAFVLVSLPCSWLLGIHMGYGIMGIWGASPWDSPWLECSTIFSSGARWHGWSMEDKGFWLHSEWTANGHQKVVPNGY